MPAQEQPGTITDLVPLNNANLPVLPDGVEAPGYDRGTVRPGVVHIGVGGFHRAHQAVYFDELARRGLAADWGLVGVGLHSPQMGEVLKAQDGLYLVVERSGAGTTARVVAAMGRYLYAPDERPAVLDALSDPATRLVTLTITGNGYNLTSDGEFSVDDPLVASELEDPGRPDTVFGYLVEALDRRRRAGAAPFTVLSCDNIPSNGVAARTMVVSFAELRDPELARWIDEHVAFPSSMVDRITPETTPEERDRIVRSFGIDDRWPVITERFTQWVIEDRFCNDRPPLEKVGVQFVEDVAPYELTKKRLLNASHCALGYLGYLAGYRTTAEVMADPAYAAYISALVDEIKPLLPAVDGIDLDKYQAALMERLANPEIADQLSRLCRRGSTKVPSYLLPSITETLEQGRPVPLLTLAVAGWFRYLQGEDYAGDPIRVEGPREDELVPLAQQDGLNPRPLLTVRDVFDSLADNPEFVRDLHVASEALRAGPRETIETWLSVRGVR
ncbi:mannitol dehydrogenase family protein [Couchioplanes azureus]|uniref:mannitol dehydrogenase family protein n=1 Tax=Couchioplanes caeruleus TaxID=56438 RepID=UPI00167166C9|nr:mannitol dehydrogenase family protein [Couchioplanes caeruleus]GGQ77365.1 mannitol dehydrogenase [Couchioplanes caeruleus subsp. azureus]